MRRGICKNVNIFSEVVLIALMMQALKLHELRWSFGLYVSGLLLLICIKLVEDFILFALCLSCDECALVFLISESNNYSF